MMKDKSFLLVLVAWHGLLLLTNGFVLPGGRRTTTTSSRMHSTFGFDYKNSEDKNIDDDNWPSSSSPPTRSTMPTRRSLLQSCLPLVASSLFIHPQPAKAELVQFPCPKGTLRNTYHFMRAGESKLEEQNVWGTNPLFLTNRENALSDHGIQQVQDACQILDAAQLNLSIVKFPLAANAIDTSDIIASQLQIGRNSMVPEYTYMDQRGVGKWDMLPLQSTQEAVWAMDSKDDKDGWGGIPPPNDDGTANEMLGHQVTRLRQLISLLESFASGDSILLIFPDGTGPALLSCLIAGIPLNRVHELHYNPGEVRLDVNYDTVRSMVPTIPTKEYTEAIQRGAQHLQVLRDTKSHDLINVKDQVYNEEVLQLEAAGVASKAATRKRQQEAQEERQKRYDAMTAQDVFAAAGIGASLLGLVAVTGNSNDNNDKEEEIVASVGASNDGTTTTTTSAGISPLQPPPNDASISKQKENYKELQTMEELIDTAPIAIPEFGSSSSGVVPGGARQEEPVTTTTDLYGTTTNIAAAAPPTEEDRVQIASQAMQDYMDQDDGGDAFLDMLSELINEEVEAETSS